MDQFDITTPEGLQSACMQALRRLDGNPAKVARVAAFLQKIRDHSAEERETVNFMRLLWADNLLYKVPNDKKMNVSIAIYRPDFPRHFLALIDDPLPEDPKERIEQLDHRMLEAKRLACPITLTDPTS